MTTTDIEDGAADDPDLMASFPAAAAAVHDGFIKLKLVHGVGYTVFLADALFLDGPDGWRWFEPAMFDPPILSFLGARSYAQFGLVTSGGDEVLVATTDDRFVARFPDGSQLFRCRVAGRPDLMSRSTGEAVRREDGGFDLRLFHHTSPAALEAIGRSGELWGSARNVRGNRGLVNVAYAYLTSLPRIETPLDLRAIAMASDGVVYFLLDNRSPPDGLVRLAVDPQDAADRSATLALRVPAECVAGQHLWRHAPDDRGVFYESSHPAIYRVGLEPGATLKFADGAVRPDVAGLKRFAYAVVGDATRPDGILAPFEEETTGDIVKVEPCEDVDILTFWRTRRNEDHFSGKAVEIQALRPAARP